MREIARLAQLDRASASGPNVRKGSSASWPTVDPECSDRCLACGARILWARTERGASKRLNARATPFGSLVWEGEIDDGAPVVRLLRAQDRFSVRSFRYTDHAATCRAVAA
jgi:hypothetical protein